MSFLDRIAPEKWREVEGLKANPPASDGPPIRDFEAALRAPGVRAIAEVKRRSPSQGEIRPGADPVDIARAYERNGAAALSVLTDGPHFGGALDDLRRVREAVNIPVLRKDFLVHPLQVQEARGAGADAVLLIVAMLDDDTLQGMLAEASRLGMAALVEVHSNAELDRALTSEVRILGVNNRDLTNMKIDLANAEGMLPRAPAHMVRVAESGLYSPADVQRMRRAGADAVLVGTALMKAPDPGLALRSLMAGSR